MAVMRSILLAGSQSPWLREKAPRSRLLRRSVARFMPGETMEEAVSAAQNLTRSGFRVLLTRLGEDIADRTEAGEVADHYLLLLDRLRPLGAAASLSVKLTQLGLNIGRDVAWENLEKLLQRAGESSFVWIDMESSQYVDVTLDLYRRARERYASVGVCLQAYLYRTETDLRSLLPGGAAIRLVKGAYREPPERAYPKKKDVDENFFALTQLLLGQDSPRAARPPVMGTHDRGLIRRIEQLTVSLGRSKDDVEFQMLYGIARDEQMRLLKDGWRSGVLISYGEHWFPWYMRRLAERPANLVFLLRNLRG